VAFGVVPYLTIIFSDGISSLVGEREAEAISYLAGEGLEALLSDF